MLDYGWSWEDDITATKLLGIHIDDEIVHGLMTKKIKVKLERGLQRLKINPTSLIGRVIAINNLILSSIWFAIALWVGSDFELKGYEKEITKFMWSCQRRRKKHKVAEFILFLS